MRKQFTIMYNVAAALCGLLIIVLLIRMGILLQRRAAQPTAVATTQAIIPHVTPTLAHVAAQPTRVPVAVSPSPSPHPTALPAAPPPTLQPTIALIPTPTSQADDSQPIIFSTNRDHNFEIYRMNSDGSQLARLTENEVLDSDPRWSPDGQRIAFNSVRDGNWEIYVMDADGSHVTRLTNYQNEDFFPTWSPDGTRIAFISYRGQYGPTINIMNADGSQVIDTNVNASPPFDWSPDGSKIVFSYGTDIFVMDADGTHVRKLISTPTDDIEPNWSPDGQRIVFVSGEASILNNGSQDIYIANADGTNLINLTHTSVNDRTPVWSSDGSQIVFMSISPPRGPAQTNYYEIYTIRADGSGLTRLSDTPLSDNESPDWRPAVVQASR
jgi:Tol biopolymer transport system component